MGPCVQKRPLVDDERAFGRAQIAKESSNGRAHHWKVDTCIDKAAVSVCWTTSSHASLSVLSSLGHKSLHKLYLYFQHWRCTRAGKNHFWACLRLGFIPVLSAFGVILVADVLHYQVSLFGLMKVVSLWHTLVLDTWLLPRPSWFLPNSALTLFFVCWECLSICAFLPSQLYQLPTHLNYFNRGFATGNSLDN